MNSYPVSADSYIPQKQPIGLTMYYSVTTIKRLQTITLQRIHFLLKTGDSKRWG